jgi:hypothetical protein
VVEVGDVAVFILVSLFFRRNKCTPNERERERESLHQSNPHFVLFRYFKKIIIITTKTEKNKTTHFEVVLINTTPLLINDAYSIHNHNSVTRFSFILFDLFRYPTKKVTRWQINSTPLGLVCFKYFSMWKGRKNCNFPLRRKCCGQSSRFVTVPTVT